MAMRAITTIMTILAALALLALAGCSSDDGDPTAPGGSTVTFTDYASRLSAVAPPEFTSLSKAGADSGYGWWMNGDYPLLGKAVGNALSDEPMSLYRNLNTLDATIAMIEGLVAQGEGGTGTGTFTVDTLTAPVAIPAGAQGALGFAQIELQQVARFALATGGYEVHLAWAQTETDESVLTWMNEGADGATIFYATHDLQTDHVEIRGATYKEGQDETASWIYHIGTADADNSAFTYNMAWYSSTMGDTPGLGCVQGSGDRDTVFGLRFHQYRAPWSSGQYDWQVLEQLFGPVGAEPYADLNVDGQYPAAHAGLIDEAAMFLYDDMPHALFASPFAN
ncbi:MAG: hypothetical protein ABR506_07165 [Candidatus Krumholzibacteriia bacterium]